MGSYGKYEVQWKRSAEKDLRRLDPQQIPRIIMVGSR
jgi:mRNA-degrading endonuclease RelE of RelBE toxin-antitoxin system